MAILMTMKTVSLILSKEPDGNKTEDKVTRQMQPKVRKIEPKIHHIIDTNKY